MLNMERKPEFHPRKRVEIIGSIPVTLGLVAFRVATADRFFYMRGCE